MKTTVIKRIIGLVCLLMVSLLVTTMVLANDKPADDYVEVPYYGPQDIRPFEWDDIIWL